MEFRVVPPYKQPKSLFDYLVAAKPLTFPDLSKGVPSVRYQASGIRGFWYPRWSPKWTSSGYWGMPVISTAPVMSETLPGSSTVVKEYESPVSSSDVSFGLNGPRSLNYSLHLAATKAAAAEPMNK